ncbi:MAG: hypothetical protein RB292_05295 [Patescibacteria group bacterium]|jgi:hypothetical protein|nr:hypothetical protein [Patescibacteria group bacterium]
MKNCLLIISLLTTLVLTGCVNNTPINQNTNEAVDTNQDTATTTNEVTPTQAIIQENNNPSTTTEEIDTSDWLTYRNEEVGFEIRYPSDVSINMNKELSFDTGEKRYISLKSKINSFSMSLVATTPDYVEDAGEGCCFYFSGLPISSFDNYNFLKFFSPFNIENIVVDNTIGLKFFRVNYYVSFWISRTVIVPIFNSRFTNILINSPEVYLVDELGLDENIKQEAIQIVKSGTHLNEEMLDNIKIFEKILRTLKFFKSI